MSRVRDLARRALVRLLKASGLRHQRLRRWLFRSYYDENSWGDAESRSGPGSNLEQTKVIRAELPRLFERWDVRTLLDVPCGDGHWWTLVDHDLDAYIGVDVVPEMIAAREAGARPGETFRCLDVTSDPLPRADAILCRDLLVHFSYDQALAAIAAMKASGAELLVTTTFPGRTNVDIRTGGWRPLDLTAPPFGFPAPLDLVDEECTEDGGQYADKSLGVWRLRDITVASPAPRGRAREPRAAGPD